MKNSCNNLLKQKCFKTFLGQLQLKLRQKPLSGQFPIIRSCIQKIGKLLQDSWLFGERTYMSLKSYNIDDSLNNDNNCCYF